MMVKDIISYSKNVYKTRKRAVVDPKFITFITTFRCNARCIMCDSWKKDAKGDLSLDEIENIFSQIPSIYGIRLSGGEPFVRQDLKEIVALAHRYLSPRFIHITTNGFLTERIIDLCETRDKSTPLYLLISIDGMKDTHDEIRNVSRAWDRATATLKALEPRQDELNLKIAINQTIVSREGIEEYHRFSRS